MHNGIIKSFLFVTSVALVGCSGGGGESSSSTPSSSTSTTSVVPSTSVATTSNSSSSYIVINSSAIEGLSLKCGSKSISSSKDGAFSCSSSPLSAYLGEFKIGQVSTLPVDKILYTQDLLGIARGATTHPDVTKISMILQSLDRDASPLNGIQLSSNTLALLSSHLRYDSVLEKLSFEDVEYIIEDVIKDAKSQDENSKLKAVTQEKAQLNLTTMTAQMPAPSYAQRTSGRI